MDFETRKLKHWVLGPSGSGARPEKNDPDNPFRASARPKASYSYCRAFRCKRAANNRVLKSQLYGSPDSCFKVFGPKDHIMQGCWAILSLRDRIPNI